MAKFSIKSIVVGTLGIALLLLIFRPSTIDSGGYYLHVYDPDHCLTLKVYPKLPFSCQWNSGTVSIRGCIEMKNADSGKLEYQFVNEGKAVGHTHFQVNTCTFLYRGDGGAYFVISKNGDPEGNPENTEIDGITGATY